jgi:ABC-type sugar transport system ATPase subunit
LGPSGAGKTSLLRLLAGLERPDCGAIVLDERDITRIPPQRRRIALVSQDDSLFPHLTIYDNLAFAMRLRKLDRAAIDRSVRDYAELLKIESFLHERPARLSGGERQRAALARALLSAPRVLLLDEPFAHLDPQLRVHVRRQFREVRQHFPGPVLHVTHDHGEALASGDRLAIMMEGRIEQCAAPDRVYEFPANVRIARFFGSPPMNLIERDGAIIGIRPEYVRIGDDAALRGTVEEIEAIGPDFLAHIKTPLGVVAARIPRAAADSVPAIGQQTGVSFPPQYVRRFDAAGDALLT